MSSQFKFSIRRLVLVDSAGFCYVEIPVDEHAVLLGTGNLGKSSLLNSLRLFLLPENSFRNSRKKFAFRNASAGSHYSNEESYQHYFPGQYSFLIMEVENAVGVHCQILYRDRAADLSYGRIFAPVAYSDLRPLFWNADDGQSGERNDDGIGSAVAGLSFSKVAEAVRKLTREAVFTSDTGKLKSMLYGSDLMSADAVRYSVLPLADSDERKVQSLRTLILLLFEMKSDDRAMADAVANIIEADKKFADDAFDFDIDQFLTRHEELKRQETHLTRIERERPRFASLTEGYQRYGEMARSQTDFASFGAGLTAALGDAREAHQDVSRTRLDLKNTCQYVAGQVTVLEKQIAELTGKTRAHKDNLHKAEQNQQKGEILCAQHVGMTHEEIKAILTEELAQARQQLNAFKSTGEAALQKARLGQQLAGFDEQLARLEQRRERQQWQLQRQLDEAVAAPLQAIDARLLIASPGQALDPQTAATIRAFSELLVPRGNGFLWFDTEFSHRPLQEEDLEAQAGKLQSERRAIECRLGELDTSNQDTLDLPQRIDRAEKESKSLSGDLDLIERLPGARIAIADANSDIAECEKSIAQAQEQLAIEKEKAAAVEERLRAAEAVSRRLDERERDLIQMNTAVGSFMRRFPHLESTDTPTPTPDLTVSRLDEISLVLEQMGELRLSILNSVRYFVRERILDDPAGDLQQDSPLPAVIRESYRALSDVFAEVREQWEVLREQITAHNETVSSYRLALLANFEHIKRFESQLNAELEGVAINDLVEIRVDIHTHPKFRNLVAESESIDPFSDKLQSDAFYERLRVFVDEFFIDQSHGYRLTMDKVITGIAYRTRKQGAQSLDKKGQSTSTTALINLELVHRLLRRVLYPGVELSFPMVLDELASVDVSQIPALLTRLKAQGFNLFSAATHSASPEVIYQVGRHLEVGLMRTAKPYDARRTLVFWGGAEGFARQGAGQNWLEQEQSGLWDTQLQDVQPWDLAHE